MKNSCIPITHHKIRSWQHCRSPSNSHHNREGFIGLLWGNPMKYVFSIFQLQLPFLSLMSSELKWSVTGTYSYFHHVSMSSQCSHYLGHCFGCSPLSQP